MAEATLAPQVTARDLRVTMVRLHRQAMRAAQALHGQIDERPHFGRRLSSLRVDHVDRNASGRSEFRKDDPKPAGFDLRLDHVREDARDPLPETAAAIATSAVLATKRTLGMAETVWIRPERTRAGPSPGVRARCRRGRRDQPGLAGSRAPKGRRATRKPPRRTEPTRAAVRAESGNGAIRTATSTPSSTRSITPSTK